MLDDVPDENFQQDAHKQLGNFQKPFEKMINWWYTDLDIGQSGNSLGLTNKTCS